MRVWVLSLLISFSLSCLAEGPPGQTALVIIDMQPPFVTRGHNDKKPDNIKKVNQILDRQIELIKLARDSKTPIIFIEYKGFGDTNVRLKNAIAGYSNVKTFVKNTDGMLDSSNASTAKLYQYLKNIHVSNLLITGANGGACVEASIEQSLKKGFRVLAYSQGIADFNYEDFIYPYHYEKGHWSYVCKTCKFTELDDYSTVAFKLLQSDGTVSKKHIEDSGRGTRKDIAPATKTGTILKTKQATAQ